MGITVFHVTLLIAGILLFGVATLRAWSRWSRRGWKEAEAEVLYSDVRPADGSKGQEYVGVCILSYRSGGERFIGQFHFARSSDYAEVTRAGQRYSAGQRRQILIRPGTPDRVELQAANVADLRFAAACAVLGSICTVAAFTWFRNA